MIYRIRHATVYSYRDPVAVSHHILRLSPRDTGFQICRSKRILVTPKPAGFSTHTDYFGNVVTLFTLLEPHDALAVEAASELEVNAAPRPPFDSSPPWESVRDLLLGAAAADELEASQFVFDSKRAPRSRMLADYGRESFSPGRPLLDAALDLTHRIHRDFRFDSKATEVSTPVETFFKKGRGVCQDFAHLEIACLRSVGLPARYVSGYLRTVPASGRPRLTGADASHAWTSVWCPEYGWIDFDPTNDCVPSDGHITVAWGRDYGDVSPVYGVLLGGAHHTLAVGVDVLPVA